MVFVLEESETEEETTPQKLGRNIARSGARAVESLGGIGGDLLSLISQGVEKGGKALGVPEEVIEKGKTIGKSLSPLGGLPTSEEIKEKFSERLGGEYLKPQSSGEEFSDEIVGDAAQLLLPIKGKIPFGKQLLKHTLRALGTAAGANSAASIAGALGAEEKGKTATKLGSMLLMGALGRGSPKKYVGNLYKEAEEAIKGAPRVPTHDLRAGIREIERGLRKGLKAPSEKAVLSKIKELNKKMARGTIGVDELWASKRSLNEEMAKALFESPSKGAKARAKNLFKSVNKKINTELDKYAKDNPAFGKAYKSAEEGFAALAQSELLGNFIRNNAKYSPNSILLYPLIHAFPGTSAAAAAGGAGAYKGAQLAYRLAKSKALRTHYKNVLKAAAQGNSGAMNNNLKKMDEELSKQPKDKSSAGRFILED